MRFSLEILLEEDRIIKDKNRMFISLIKHSLESYDKEYYESLYGKEPNKVKSFTFSLYMGNCIFEREEILIPNKKIILNFSTNSMEDSLYFYNSFLAQKGKPYHIKGNTMTINKINLVKEKLIVSDEVIFKSISPVVSREHRGNNHDTWYYSLNEEKGKQIFMENLKLQLIDEFGEERRFDIDKVEVEILNNKEVKVKHYGIEVLSNICRLKIKAKPYILDYLYKAGISSRRSQGFGMMDLV
ncbi:CRISPR-associated endoribonuclease Cas6 [Tissierella creatinophila]|uniref:CRISPR associated protein Cas6 n=1 Tax=Tissierella creatinophila DSM 6911 TaxID=1123403 RepID=A0A1U7M8F9_TISCR|nr:CRISPR-associated endoribonuclease Cas6 [Tissierella creatinophila]OLS03602.1 CRISPR associated protein Cas6 [Tissierella creatinophila DSM 6911]